MAAARHPGRAARFFKPRLNKPLSRSAAECLSSSWRLSAGVLPVVGRTDNARDP
jgi:hypothetical protein